MSQRRNQTNTRTKQPFQEDSTKAVFLSGFKDNIPASQWRDYREAVYQTINKKYDVYIRKLDLPVNSKFGYLHCRTAREATKLLNLPSCSDRDYDRDNDLDSETNGPCMQLAGDNVYVFEYKKTQKRKNEELCRTRRGHNQSRLPRHQPRGQYSNCSTRDASPEFTAYNSRNRSSNDDFHRCSDQKDHLRAPAKLNQNPLSAPDSALVTLNGSDDERDLCPEKMRASSPMNHSSRSEVSSNNYAVSEVDGSSSDAQPTNVEEKVLNDCDLSNEFNVQVAIQPDQIQPHSQILLPTLVQPSKEATMETTPTTRSFDEVCKNFEKNDKVAQLLLSQNWAPSLDELPDRDQIQLMAMFLLTFKTDGPEAACSLIHQILNTAQLLRMYRNIQDLSVSVNVLTQHIN